MKSPCIDCPEHQRHIKEYKVVEEKYKKLNRTTTKIGFSNAVPGKNERRCIECKDRVRYANYNLGIPLSNIESTECSGEPDNPSSWTPISLGLAPGIAEHSKNWIG